MHTGKVIIAGAGPGDPGLLTLKTAQYLQQADVILVDRLVSEDILTLHTRTDAECIYVGKQCRKGLSVPQSAINELMVGYAQLGKLVVRLKGGDVSVFSNVLDELEALVDNHIPYEVVPGITAALGAAAYAGIPLTARGYTTAVRLLTAYTKDVVSDDYWRDLAQTRDTLVFYMSSETLEDVVANLVRHGIAPARKLAVVEQATTPLQQVTMLDLYDTRQPWKDKSWKSPSLLIVGEVTSLHERYGWVPNGNSNDHYFPPIAGAAGLVVQPSKVA
jgi:uroporphyrin-III C-methyltransferase/precorrin-2 dehydrogenase/sirohydrochlorin ferrochelatase/uroporphyrin-III C-methyltransferase